MRLIGSFISGKDASKTDDDGAAMNVGREWSDPELTALGNMRVGGLPTEEITRFLRWEHVDVRDKVVEIGRICR